MKKERIKSIALILLIITNFVLADKILVDKKLWLSGYNFFANMRNTSKKSGTQIAEGLAIPEKLIINTGYQSTRLIYNRSSEDFDAIFSAVRDTLCTAFSSKTVFSATNEDWYAALTAQSIHISYPCRFSSQIYAEILGVNPGDINAGGFSDIAVTDSGNVYINDASGIFRISVPYANIGEIIAQTAERQNDEDIVINYSFDLNFDKEFGNQKTYLSPMILIYSAPIRAHVLEADNPVFRNGAVNSRSVENILSAFSIAPNSVRRYTEADGTLVFVENNGTLKISPEGILTFTAHGSGLRYSRSDITDTHTAAEGIAEFVDSVNNALGITTEMCITSPLTREIPSEITFDCLADGLPVKYIGDNAVTVQISGEYITSYSQILRNYSVSSEMRFSPMYIEALDGIIAKYQDSMNEIRIREMFPAYIDDLSEGEKTADWYIDINNVIAE